MEKVVYLHGFNSDGNGFTAKTLKSIYGEKLESVSYDYINPINAEKEIKKFLKNLLKSEKNIVLVGTSLGGFWANYFAQKFDLKCVLANPTFNPSLSLQKFIGENKNYTTNKIEVLTQKDCDNYKKFEIPISKLTFRITYLSKNDELINYKDTEKQLIGTKIYYSETEKHQVKDFNAFSKIIDEAINTFVH